MGRAVGKQRELGEFLRSRRARIRPEDVGFASGSGVRRVPGLRREELAHLAGVSVDYYVRLEQGRNQSASDAVLGAVADALRLDADERAHFFRLARPRTAAEGGFGTGGASVRSEGAPGAQGTAASPQDVRPGVRQMLAAISVPAVVTGRRLDVLAWNRPACALIADFAALPRKERNLCRLHILDAEISRHYPDREMVAREAVGHLRLAQGRCPDDPELTELVGELHAHSEEFRRHWALHTVRTKAHGKKRIDHPLVGPLALDYEVTRFPQDPETQLIVYTGAPGSPEEKALRILAAHAPEPPSGGGTATGTGAGTETATGTGAGSATGSATGRGTENGNRAVPRPDAPVTA